MLNINTNGLDSEDEDEILEPETVAKTEPQNEEDNTKAELERLQAENEALRLATTIKDEVIEKPVSSVEKYMKELGLEDEADLKDYLPILKENDRLAMEAYESKVKLAELSKNPTIRKAQLENEAAAELGKFGNAWEAEFFEVYEHSEQLAALKDKDRAEMVKLIGTRLSEVLVDRKINNKPQINPMLVIQKDITKKLKELTSPKQDQTKPATPNQTYRPLDPKKLMSLSSASDFSKTFITSTTQNMSPKKAQRVATNMSGLTHLLDLDEDF